MAPSAWGHSQGLPGLSSIPACPFPKERSPVPCPLPLSFQAPHCLTSFQKASHRARQGSDGAWALQLGGKQPPFPGSLGLPCPKPATSKPRGQQVGTVGSRETTGCQVGRWSPRGSGALLGSGLVPQTRVCALRGVASPCQASGKHLWRPAGLSHTPDCLPPSPPHQELITLNPVSFVCLLLEAGSSSRARASVSLFSPPSLFFFPTFTKHKLFLRLEFFIPASLTLTQSLARGGHSARVHWPPDCPKTPGQQAAKFPRGVQLQTWQRAPLPGKS